MIVLYLILGWSEGQKIFLNEGEIKGETVNVEFIGEINEFLGIPYASNKTRYKQE